jgi:hypothetical protein
MVRHGHDNETAGLWLVRGQCAVAVIGS